MSRRDQKKENLQRFYLMLEQIWDEYLAYVQQSEERLKEFMQKFRASMKDIVQPVYENRNKSAAELPVESNEKRKVFTAIEQFLAKFSAVVAEAKTSAKTKLKAALQKKGISEDSPTAKHGEEIIDHTFSTAGIVNDAIHLQAQGKAILPSKHHYHEAMHPRIDAMHNQYQKSDTTHDLIMLVVALRHAAMMNELSNNYKDTFEPEFHMELFNDYTPEFNHIAQNGHSLLAGFKNELMSPQYNSARLFQAIDDEQVSVQHKQTNHRTHKH